MQIDRLFAQTQRRLDAEAEASARRHAERAAALDRTGGTGRPTGSGSWANAWGPGTGQDADAPRPRSWILRAVRRLRPRGDG